MDFLSFLVTNMANERRRDHHREEEENSSSLRLSSFLFFSSFLLRLSSSVSFISLFLFGLLSLNVLASSPPVHHSSSSSFDPLLLSSPSGLSSSSLAFSTENFHPSLHQPDVTVQNLHHHHLFLESFPAPFSSFLQEANELQLPSDEIEIAEERGDSGEARGTPSSSSSSSSSSRTFFLRRLARWLRKPGPVTRGLRRIGRRFDEFISRHVTHPSLSRSRQGEVSLPVISDTFLRDPGRSSLQAIVRASRSNDTPSSSHRSSSSSFSEGERLILEGVKKKIGLTERASSRSVVLEESRASLYLRLENKGLLSLDEGKIDYAVDQKPLTSFSSRFGIRRRKNTERTIHLLARVLFHTSLSYRAQRRDFSRRALRRRSRPTRRSASVAQGDEVDTSSSRPSRSDEERRRRLRELQEETRELTSASLLLRMRFASLLKFFGLLQCPSVDAAYSQHRLLAPIAILSIIDARPGTLLTVSPEEEKKKNKRFLRKTSETSAVFDSRIGKQVHFLNEILIYPQMASNLYDFVVSLSSSPLFLSLQGTQQKTRRRNRRRDRFLSSLSLSAFSLASAEERDKRWGEERARIRAAKGSLTRQIIYIFRNLSTHGLHHRSPGVYSFGINEEGYVLLSDLDLLTLDPSRESSSSSFPPQPPPRQDSKDRRSTGEEEKQIEEDTASLRSSSSPAYPRPEELDLTVAPPELLKLYLSSSSHHHHHQTTTRRRTLQESREEEDEEEREKRRRFLPVSASPAIDAWRLGAILYYIWCHRYLIPLDLNPLHSSSSRFIRMSSELAIEALKVIEKNSIDFANLETCPGGAGREAAGGTSEIPSEVKVLIQRLLDRNYETRLLVPQIPLEDERFINIFEGNKNSSSSSSSSPRGAGGAA